MVAWQAGGSERERGRRAGSEAGGQRGRWTGGRVGGRAGSRRTLGEELGVLLEDLVDLVRVLGVALAQAAGLAQQLVLRVVAFVPALPLPVAPGPLQSRATAARVAEGVADQERVLGGRGSSRAAAQQERRHASDGRARTMVKPVGRWNLAPAEAHVDLPRARERQAEARAVRLKAGRQWMVAARPTPQLMEPVLETASEIL